MALKHLFDLQFFAEGGGDGGASAGADGASAMGDGAEGKTEYPANIPERAKKYYDKVAQRSQKVDTAAKPTESTPTTEEETPIEQPPARKSYKELVESDEYKADHEKYVQRVVRDRMKTHMAAAEKDAELFQLIGRKYGLDTASETFKEDLSNAIKADDGVYEKYAEEHDVSITEAKRMVGLEEQLARANKEVEARRVAEENAKVINALREKGNETKSQYPEFDLDAQMADDRFRRLVVAFNGDTTQAYEAINHKALTRRAVAEAESQAQRAVSNSVKTNLSRPAEGGISSSTNSTPTPDFRSMGLQGIRAWADTQRHKR